MNSSGNRCENNQNPLEYTHNTGTQEMKTETTEQNYQNKSPRTKKNTG